MGIRAAFPKGLGEGQKRSREGEPCEPAASRGGPCDRSIPNVLITPHSVEISVAIGPT